MDKELPRAAISDVFLDSWLRQLIGEADMPARKIRPSRYSVTGYAPTTKGAKAQDAESSLEHDFLTLLEYDQRVERYVAQPFTIEWRDTTGSKRRYTPDVIVKYSYVAMREDPYLRTTLFEVKPRAVLKTDWLELKPKFRSAIGWAKEFGCRFHLVTENEIRTPYLANARFLLDYRSRHLPDRSDLIAVRQHLIARTLAELQMTTPRGLLAAMTSDQQLQAELIPWVWNLINQDFIGVDLFKPLTMVSPIWPTENLKFLLEDA
jgi:hypothetical protein